MFLEQLALMNDECLLPHVIAGRHFFFKKVYRCSYIFLTAMLLLSLTEVL